MKPTCRFYRSVAIACAVAAVSACYHASSAPLDASLAGVTPATVTGRWTVVSFRSNTPLLPADLNRLSVDWPAVLLGTEIEIADDGAPAVMDAGEILRVRHSSGGLVIAASADESWPVELGADGRLRIEAFGGVLHLTRGSRSGLQVQP